VPEVAIGQPQAGPPGPSTAAPLAGRRIVVTGASSGIGQAIAFAFAQAGATLVLGCWGNPAGAEAARDAIVAAGGRAVVVRHDLATLEGCRALIAEAASELGGFDVLVNNAGADILTGAAARWPVEEKLDLLLDVDLRGTIRCSRAAADVFAAQPPGGVIINIGWDQATTGMAGENPEIFSAVKAGILGYTKSLARTLAPHVRVNVLCPGWIETEFGAGVDRDYHRSVA
jgi:3-oxoacyl-[acyl-carrier protein] reductase